MIKSSNINPVSVSNEANLGTLTWAGGGDPAGTVVKTYRWFQSGKNTSVTFPLPSDVPVPSTWGTQESSGLVVVGAGSIASAVTGTASGIAGLYEDGAGGWVVKVFVAALAAKSVSVSLNWIRA